ncbi:hypothetical protein AB1I70_05055 [Bacillus mobilis]|uniref:DUF1295 domain-containing protein n=1 Tax=Bacillus mobilis TaxID=2026190 RepID=A0ABV4RP42_9BACI|nr:Protein of unknown function [Bacillus mobilis]
MILVAEIIYLIIVYYLLFITYFKPGIFKYAIHINYLGDCIWVLCLALISSDIFSLFIPLGLFLVFIFDYIPKSDDYLQNKYGEQFTVYKQKTKKLIPFIW